MSVSQQDLFLFNNDLVWKTTRVTARGNTTQHETTRVQHENTRHNTSSTRHNTSKARLNTSTQEARAAKIGLYFALFVAKLCIFLTSFRNS